MYKKILVALENSDGDTALIPHVKGLAQQFGSQLLLIHVADGWVARNFDRLKLNESDEMRADRAYLEAMAGELRQAGLSVVTHLALGDPPAEILRIGEAERCDLIAMTSHGHRLLGDILYGSTIEEVRHRTSIPLLIVRAEKK